MLETIIHIHTTHDINWSDISSS